MARNGNSVDGFDEVIERLRREVKDIEDKSMDGLLAGAMQIQANAQRRAPQEDSNLVGGAYTRRTGGKQVETGFEAVYARRVHESREEKLRGVPRGANRRGRHWDGGESAYLEKAVEDESDNVVNQIRARARRKG